MRSILGICLTACVLFASCSKDTTETGIDAVNQTDRTFGANTARLYLTQIALGQVMFDHGSDTTVIRLAEKMILFNRSGYNELIEIARTKSISMPNSMNDEQEALEASLNTLSGHALDSAYMHVLQQQQNLMLQEYETLISSGSNGTLKDHGERYRDTLNMHHAYTDSLVLLY